MLGTNLIIWSWKSPGGPAQQVDREAWIEVQGRLFGLRTVTCPRTEIIWQQVLSFYDQILFCGDILLWWYDIRIEKTFVCVKYHPTCQVNDFVKLDKYTHTKLKTTWSSEEVWFNNYYYFLKRHQVGINLKKLWGY